MLETLMPIKDKLKELRMAAGLTQQALAVKAGLSISAVVHIEAGRIPDPRVSTLKALARALGCRIDDLAENGGKGRDAGVSDPDTDKPRTRGKGK